MEIVTKIAPIILALIMLGLGLGLRFEDFARVFKSPKDFFVGFFSQIIILPLIDMRPSKINSSDLRLEATPQCARYLFILIFN